MSRERPGCLLPLLMGTVLFASAVACERRARGPQGAAERAGAAIDDTAQDVADAAGRAADDVGESIDEAADELEGDGG